MKTLLLENGDLVIGEGGFAMIEGSSKVRQDLGIALREQFGLDRFHPRWGSILYDYIGQPVSTETHMFIESECARIVQNYAMLQTEYLERDLAKGVRPRFSTGELIQSIEKILVAQQYDTFRVRIILRTVSGTQVVLTQSVSSGGAS